MIAYTLNLLDLFCTLWALRHGAGELNPFMQSIPLMVGYKVVIVWALLRWLSHQREQAARRGLALCAVVYGAVCAWHAIGLLVLTAR